MLLPNISLHKSAILLIQKIEKQFLTLFFLVLSLVAYAQDAMIRIDVKEKTTLKSFINLLESEHGFLFSYKEEDVDHITLTALSMQAEVSVVLTKVLQGTRLQFEIVNNNYIVLSQRAKREEGDWLTFCGRVMDEMTSSPLAFANVHFLKSKKGTTTTADGSFEIKEPLMANDSLVISYVGYEEQRFLAKDFIIKPCLEIALAYLNMGDDFVVVTEYLTEGIELNSNDLSTQLRPNKAGILPGQAEPDVMETLQFLPGVSSTDGTASGLSIRGGTPDQNLILWEDIPIYHAAHYFGTISAFNPYIIDKVSVYRGGFGADYGGRVSGVVDLKSEDLQPTDNNIGLGMNLLNLYANGRVSMLDHKLKVIFSARRSYTEWWRSPAYESLTRRIQQGVLVQDVDLDNLPKSIQIDDEFSFFDSNLKIAYQVSDKDQLTVSGFYGHNDFEGEVFDNLLKQRQTDTLFLDNKGLSMSWEHQWNERLSTRLLAVHSKYQYNYEYRLQSQNTIPGQPPILTNNKNGIKNSKIKEQQIRLINTFKTKRAREFKLAYQLTDYTTDFTLAKMRENEELEEERRNKESNLHVLYGVFITEKEAPFGLDAGLRINYFELDKNASLEPRLRLWYQPYKHLNFHINGGKYHQFLSQLYEIAGDDASISTPVWSLAGGKQTPVLEALQFQAGVIYQHSTWLVDFQLYAKKINGQSSLSSGFNEDLSSRFLIGSVQVRGVDVLLKKRWGDFRSWMSYTLSKNDYQFPGFLDSGFPAPNDQRHIFNWSNAYTKNHWAFSLGWKISSGRPYSLLANFELRTSQQGSGTPREFIFPVVKEFNSASLPATHQLDAAIRYTILPKTKGQWKGVIGLSLLNVYDQRNIYSRTFSIQKRSGMPARLKYIDKVDLGFTPNMVIRLEW